MTPLMIKDEIAMITVDNHRYRARVVETQDEWIYIDIQDKLYGEDKKYFKCDQWDGVIQCLKDNRLIERFFNKNSFMFSWSQRSSFKIQFINWLIKFFLNVFIKPFKIYHIMFILTFLSLIRFSNSSFLKYFL